MDKIQNEMKNTKYNVLPDNTSPDNIIPNIITICNMMNKNYKLPYTEINKIALCYNYYPIIYNENLDTGFKLKKFMDNALTTYGLEQSRPIISVAIITNFKSFIQLKADQHNFKLSIDETMNMNAIMDINKNNITTFFTKVMKDHEVHKFVPELMLIFYLNIIKY